MYEGFGTHRVRNQIQWAHSCKEPIRNTQHAADQALHEHHAYIDLGFARDGRSIQFAMPWKSIAAIVAVTHYLLLDPPSRAHTNDDQGERIHHAIG